MEAFDLTLTHDRIRLTDLVNPLKKMALCTRHPRRH